MAGTMKRPSTESDKSWKPHKNRRTSNSSDDQEPQRRMSTQRPSAAKSAENIKKLAAEIKGPVSPAEKLFPPKAYTQGVKAGLEAYKEERASLADLTPDGVKKRGSQAFTAQDALLDTPEVLLAQANAFSITVHKLVEENTKLKGANAQLVAQLRVDACEKAKIKQELDGCRSTSSGFADKEKAMRARMTELETKVKSQQGLEAENGKLKTEMALVKKDVEAKEKTNKVQAARLERIKGMVNANDA